MEVPNIGPIIKSYRESHNIKQADLAEQLDLNVPALSKIESGKQKADSTVLIKFLNISKEFNKVFDFTTIFAEQDKPVPKDNTDLLDMFINVCEAYPNAVKETFSKHKMGHVIRNELPMKVLEAANLSPEEYKAYGSVGQGAWAKTPWISFMLRNITESTQKGFFVTYLFKNNGKGFYLSLNQGYVYFQEKYNSEAKEKMQEITDYLKNELRTINLRLNLEEIDLELDSPLAASYEKGHIIGTYYDISNMPDEESFLNDFKMIMLAYSELEGIMKGFAYESFVESILNYKSLDHVAYVEQEMNQPDIIVQNKETGDTNFIEVKSLKKAMPRRNVLAVREALKNAQYQCEFDPDHFTFIANNGKPYVEGHHLIPIREYNRFDNNIDNPSNIVALCPNCHRALELGSKELKEKMLRKLFYNKIERLEQQGMEITFSELLEMYNIKRD